MSVHMVHLWSSKCISASEKAGRWSSIFAIRLLLLEAGESRVCKLQLVPHFNDVVRFDIGMPATARQYMERLRSTYFAYP